MAQVGTITKISGLVEAVASDGSTRVLVLGDAVNLNEQIVTVGSDSSVQISFPDGRTASLGGDEKGLLDDSVVTSAQFPDADVQATQQALVDGGQLPTDPTALGQDAPADDGGIVPAFIAERTDARGDVGVHNLGTSSLGPVGPDGNGNEQVNQAPDAVDDVGVAVEEGAGGEGQYDAPVVARGNVLANDTDDGLPNPAGDLDVVNVTSNNTTNTYTTDGDGNFVLVGEYGTLVLNPETGDYIYTVDDDNPTVDELNITDTLPESFTYTVSDGDKTDTANLNITINGANDAPIAVDDTTGNDGLTVVQGEIVPRETFTGFDDEEGSQEGPQLVQIEQQGISIDAWSFSHNGGDLTIDVLTERGIPWTDINNDGNQSNLDSMIHVYSVDSNGNRTEYLRSNDDDDLENGNDGSTDDYDSYLNLVNLPTGNYVLEISDYWFTENEIGQDFQTDQIGNPGAYQITFDGDIQITSIPELGKIISEVNSSGNNAKEEGLASLDGTGEDYNAAVASIGNVLDNDTDVDNPHDQLTVTDVDEQSIAISDEGTEIRGTYGALTMHSDGSYEYNLYTGDDENPALSSLNEGERTSEVFTYTVSDNEEFGAKTDTANLTITILGTNDAPIISVGEEDSISGAVIEDNTQDVIVDESPSPQAFTIDSEEILPTETYEQTSGVLTFNDVDVNDSHDITYELKSAIYDSNTAEPISIHDVGTFTANQNGTNHQPGEIDWSFTVQNSDIQYLAVGETIDLVYTITVEDEGGKYDTQDITVTITGTNDQPTVEAITARVLETHDDTDVPDVDDTIEDVFTTYHGDNLIGHDIDTTDTLTFSLVQDSLRVEGMPTQTVLLGHKDGNDFGLDDWGIEDDGKTRTMELDNGMVITTTSDSGKLRQYDEQRDHVGQGIGDKDGWGINSGEHITVSFANGSVMSAEFGLDGLGGHFDGTDPIATATWTAYNNGVEVASGEADVTPDGLFDISTTNVPFDKVEFSTDSPTTSNWELRYVEAEVMPADVVVHEDGSYDMIGNFNYLAAGETATVTFQYTADDGHGFGDGELPNEPSVSDPATVTITVMGTNDQPVVENSIVDISEASLLDSEIAYPSLFGEGDGEFGSFEDYAYNGQLHVSDLDVSDTHTFEWNNESVVLSLSTSNSKILGMIADIEDNPSNIESFVEGITDGNIDFSYVDEAPADGVMESATLSTVDLSPTTVQLLMNYGILILDVQSDGSYTIASPLFNLLGAHDTFSVSFDYRADDGRGFDGTDHENEKSLSEWSTMTLNIAGTNDQPIAMNDRVSIFESNLSDIGGEDTTFNGQLPYASDEDLLDNFTLKYGGVDDDHNGSVDVTTTSPMQTVDGITPVVDPAQTTVTVNEDGSYTVSNPTFNSLANGEEAVVEFSYYVDDGSGALATTSNPHESTMSDIKTVTLTVYGTNDDPIAVDDNSLHVKEGHSLVVDVLANDHDIDTNDTLSVQSTSNNQHGITDINDDGTITFTPDSDYSGLASFDYTISDGNGGTSTATASIMVTPVADAPTLSYNFETLGQENHIVNGSFESPDIGHGHWSYFDNGGVDGWSSSVEHNGLEIWDHLGSYTPSDGEQHAELDATRALDSITQSMDLLAGSYHLSFDAATRNASSKDNDFKVLWNGVLLDTITESEMHNSDGSWKTFEFDVTAIDGVNSITFAEANGDAGSDSYGPLLDNVKLVDNFHSYDLYLDASLSDTDGSESLSNITLDNMPSGITLRDSSGALIPINGDGTYTVVVDANGDANVQIFSDSVLSNSVLNRILVSDTSTENNYLSSPNERVDDSAITTVVNDDIKGDTSIVMGSGNDHLIVGDDIRGDAQVYMGKGNDTIDVHDSVFNHADIFAGSGNDIFNVGGDISGHAQVDMGKGNDTLNIGDDISGDSEITMGKGDDIVHVDDDIKNDATVNMGKGDDVLTVDDDIRGHAQVDMGKGDDTLNLGDDISDHAVVDFGEGNDHLIIGGNIEDSAKVDMGAGEDTLVFNSGTTMLNLSNVDNVEIVQINGDVTAETLLVADLIDATTDDGSGNHELLIEGTGEVNLESSWGTGVVGTDTTVYSTTMGTDNIELEIDNSILQHVV